MKKNPVIYTISANSSLDHTYYLRSLVFEDINRVTHGRVDPGGKGVNVARMVHNLGGQTSVITFLGGENGRLIADLLDQEGVRFIPVATRGETRNIFNFIEQKTGRILRVNEPGPRISSKERHELFSTLKRLDVTDRSIFSLSGSLPLGLDTDTYRTIITQIKRRTALVALDSDGEVLREGVKARPFLIKPNRWELERAAGTKISSFRRLKEICAQLIAGGISYILLTLGRKGAFLFSRDELLYGIGPGVKPVSEVGCGDAFLAGFLHAFSKGRKAADCLRLALACGTAKAKKAGTSMPSGEEVRMLEKSVRILPARSETLDACLHQK